LFNYPHSDSIETVITTHGGHLGFLGTTGVDPDFRWLDWRIIDWLGGGQQESRGELQRELVRARV
jgi:predicted alpha/beta-fold hydrolase